MPFRLKCHQKHMNVPDVAPSCQNTHQKVATQQMTTPTCQPAASANYMALIRSDRGEIVPNIDDFRSKIIHLEPTLSYAIASAGYHEAHKILHTSLQSAMERVVARHTAVSSASKINVREVWRLKEDVDLLQELLDAMDAALNNLKKNKLQFEMDIHMSVVDMVRVRWELDECDF